MEYLWAILNGIPWWVYVLFLYLVSIGFKATRPRTIPLKKLILLPLLFIAWSLYNLYTQAALGYLSLVFVWLVFLALGACLGLWEVRNWHISKDVHKEEITIPGNYSTLVLILIIFVVKFFFGYLYATLSTISYWFYFLDTLTSALITGFFIGRAGFFLKSYHKH